jgi:Reverse transcriptase (RNA-dependent DNA polymerase)
LTAPIPEGYTKIPTHFVYDVKHDGRHKSRMVAGGHRTEMPVDSVYSGVVTLAGVRIVTFLAEHNGMELWGTDIGNAYLESYTKEKEKVCFTAGPEFGEQEGHAFVIKKALYGLRSSGARWHDRLYDSLMTMSALTWQP